MAGSRVRCIIVFTLVLAFTSVACKKDSKPAPGAPLAQGGPATPAVVDKIAVPALFAHVPAETPYVVGSFEAAPLDIVARMKTALAPGLARSIAMLRAFGGDSEAGRVFDAAVAELDGKWNAPGLESLGLSATPRFALYGVGLVPVFRIELKDDRVVLATVNRIAKQAGVALPPLENRSGREFWRIELDDDSGVIISLADNHLVVAGGPKSAIAPAIDVILGSQLPPNSMADGAALKAVMVAHGFGPHLVGYADSRRIATEALAMFGAQVTPACRAEIDQLVTRAPRFAVGYGEVSAKRITGGAVVELAPDLVAALEAIRTEVPGLDSVMASKAMMAFGGGFDLGKARALGSRMAQRLIEVGEACDDRGMVRSGQEMATAMMMPLPKPIEQISGAIASVESIALDLAGGRFPVKDLAGFAMVTAGSPKALFELALTLQPELANFGVKPDGKLHPVDLRALGMPFDVHAGVGDRALVVSAGPKRHGERALGLSGGGGKAPFLAMTMDYGKVMEISAQFQRQMASLYDPTAAASADFDAGLAAIYGRTDFTVGMSDRGLRMWGSMEIK